MNAKLPYQPPTDIFAHSIEQCGLKHLIDDLAFMAELYEKLSQVNARWMLDTPKWPHLLRVPAWIGEDQLPATLAKTPAAILARATTATRDLLALLDARKSGFQTFVMADASLVLSHAAKELPRKDDQSDPLEKVEAALHDFDAMLVLATALVTTNALTNEPAEFAPKPGKRGRPPNVWHDMYYDCLFWVCEVADLPPTLGGGDLPTGNLYRLAEAFEPCLLKPMRTRSPNTRLTRLLRSAKHADARRTQNEIASDPNYGFSMVELIRSMSRDPKERSHDTEDDS